MDLWTSSNTNLEVKALSTSMESQIYQPIDTVMDGKGRRGQNGETIQACRPDVWQRPTGIFYSIPIIIYSVGAKMA